MKSIRVYNNGFAMYNLFSSESTKETLIHQKGLKGSYLDELGIKYEEGDKVTVIRKADNGQFADKLVIIGTNNDYYLAEFGNNS